ncbi:MAG: hypothetical protein ACWGQW_06560, partial [bacterium]
LCSWVYSMYAVPNIQLVHIDDIDDYLLAEFGIEPGEPDNSHKKEGVEITPRLRARLKLTEDPVWWMLTRS